MIVSSNQQRKGGGYGFGPLGTVADASGGTLPLYAAADPDDADPNRSHVALSLRIRRVRCCSPVAGMCSAMLGPHQVLYSQIMRHVFDDKDARKIFFFLVINVRAATSPAVHLVPPSNTVVACSFCSCLSNWWLAGGPIALG